MQWVRMYSVFLWHSSSFGALRSAMGLEHVLTALRSEVGFGGIAHSRCCFRAIFCVLRLRFAMR